MSERFKLIGCVTLIEHTKDLITVKMIDDFQKKQIEGEIRI